MVCDETTPTRLPPPPRTVHGGFGVMSWVARLCILPHMCAGVWVLGTLGLTVWVALFGTNLRARVVKGYTSESSKQGTVYHLDYAYHGTNRDYTNSDTVSSTTYSAVTRPAEGEGRGSTVKARYFEFGPVHYHVLTEESSPWKAAGRLLLFATFWNGILSIFVYSVWIAPIRNRLLVRYGQATKGSLLSTRVSRGKSATYYAEFCFKDPSSRRAIKREMKLPGAAQYRAAQAHHPVTVIYDPRHPKRALVYELSGYRVDGAASLQ
jgi:hypothetical protein